MSGGEPRYLPVACRHLLNHCTFRKLLSRPSSTAQAGANSAQDAPSQAFCDSTPLAMREPPEAGSGPSGCPAWCQPHF